MDLSELRVGDLSKKCVQLLQECQSTENVGKRTAEAIQNRLADFVLWSDGVGALASERASLDSRFKNRPRDLVMIKGVLTGFGRFLEELRQQLAENGQPTDEALRNVDSGLENLALLAVAIRRTGTISRLKKAEDKFNPDEHRDLKKYLNLVARLRPNQDQNCPPPSEDSPRVIWRLDPKQKCLIEGVLRRRNWMLQAYKQSKALKGLEVIPEEDKLGEDSPASRSQPQNTDWSAVRPPTRPPPALKKSDLKKWSLPVRASSGVSASTPDSKAKLVIGKPIRKTSGSEGSATNITRIAASASYPGVKVVRNQTMFTCPCCFQTLGIEYSQGTLWKKHLAQDISPYTCIAVECPKPHVYYVTEAELEFHLKHDHPLSWLCLLCDQNPLQFDSEEGILGHFQEYHQTVDPEELPELVSMSLQYGLGVENCPLCDVSDTRDSPELVAHVLEHMHQFSLQCLPWAREDFQVDGGPERFNLLHPGLLAKPEIKTSRSFSLHKYDPKDEPLTDYRPNAKFDIDSRMDQGSLPERVIDRVLRWAEDENLELPEGDDESLSKLLELRLPDKDDESVSKLLEEFQSRQVLETKDESPDSSDTNSVPDWSDFPIDALNFIEQISDTAFTPGTLEARAEIINDPDSSLTFEDVSPDDRVLISEADDNKQVRISHDYTVSDEEGEGSDFEPLADLITEAFEISTFDNRPYEFLPEGRVNELITRHTIRREFELPTGETDKDVLTNFILERACKVFAIVVLCDLNADRLSDVMKLFQSSKFDDTCLPIEKPTSVFSLEAFSSHIWTRSRKARFYDEQWKFLAPVFFKTKLNYSFPSECILPFTWTNPEVMEGSSSLVFEAKIHERHREDPIFNVDGTLESVAIKEFRARSEMAPQDIEKAWDREARALREIGTLSHPHIVKLIATFTRGHKCYLMFQWANGGNLRDLWRFNTQLPSTLTADLVRQTIVQLRGLASALEAMHNYKDAPYRHGDLKPENILSFKDGSMLGILKIADMGSAELHATRTRERKGAATMTRFGTIHYEPPEVITGTTQQQSRLYDIWSMGCIILEFLIWLLYGWEELNRFYESVQAGNLQPSPFFQTHTTDGRLVASVHPVVTTWMDYIQNDPECRRDSAIKDLILLVRNQLLVVSIPSQNPLEDIHASPSGLPQPVLSDSSFRATATTLRFVFDRILGRANNDISYLFTGFTRIGMRGPKPSLPPDQNLLSLPGVSVEKLKRVKFLRDINADYSYPLNDIWEYPVDNSFTSSDLFATIAKSQPLSPSAQLCDRCFHLDIWASAFYIEDTVLELRDKAKICDFCKMLWDACEKFGATQDLSVRFERVGSILRMKMRGGFEKPALSICCSSLPKTPVPIQVGLPQLPDDASETFFQILKMWLSICDEHHQNCQNRVPSHMPTRVIDVGTVVTPIVRLYHTKPGESSRYIALTHPWGHPPHFCTTRTNFDAFLNIMNFDELPRTFQDAIMTTRTLGIRYLWIDSICVIQGPDGDWMQEASRIEDIFSSAYCVFSAISARSQRDGFLNKRRYQRSFATFFQKDLQEPFYVCELIDDFDTDVSNSALYQRGWTLQERILARRTVFFTDTQMYWQCGDEIRCETLTKMFNSQAAILGDPNFPQKAMNSTKGGKIAMYQSLYRLYSQLSFSRDSDRSTAILGIEKRLMRVYDVQGGYGIFDERNGSAFFHRSLLWQRAISEPSLFEIAFPPDQSVPVPTWSWMAYRGAIDYLDLPFAGVDWVEQAIVSPWRHQSSDTETTWNGPPSNIELSARVQNFTGVPLNLMDFQANGFNIIYDIPARVPRDTKEIKCVVLGRLKITMSPNEPRHVVMLVLKDEHRGFYRRIGVGIVPGASISFKDAVLEARIR